MSFASSLRISASGLTAQRLRMDVVSGNIANLQTTRTTAGGPYKRREVVFSASPARGGVVPAVNRGVNPTGVRVAGVVENGGTRLVSDPSHPDADENGIVAYPDIDLVQEMTDMMSAVRAYEASVAALNAAKSMAVRALDLGKV
ncbi:MAG: flagellar basal body rod protein FlgC [Sphingomonadaceae bacterium]